MSGGWPAILRYETRHGRSISQCYVLMGADVEEHEKAQEDVVPFHLLSRHIRLPCHRDSDDVFQYQIYADRVSVWFV